MGVGHYPAPAQASTFGAFTNASFGATPFGFGTEAPTFDFRDSTADAVSDPDDGTCSMDIDDVHPDSTFGMGVGQYPAPAQASTFGALPNAALVRIHSLLVVGFLLQAHLSRLLLAHSALVLHQSTPKVDAF